jgi:DNA-directed RNA polymerase subunit RPC12/RpoP
VCDGTLKFCWNLKVRYLCTLNETLNKNIMEKTYVACDHCGSTRVQTKVWVNPNSGVQQGDCGGGSDDNWCDRCEIHTSFINQVKIADCIEIGSYDEPFDLYFEESLNKFVAENTEIILHFDLLTDLKTISLNKEMKEDILFYSISKGAYDKDAELTLKDVFMHGGQVKICNTYRY